MDLSKTIVTGYAQIEGSWEKIQFPIEGDWPAIYYTNFNLKKIEKIVADKMEKKYLKRPKNIVVVANCEY